VGEQKITRHVTEHVTEIELAAILDRAASQEELAVLLEADTPAPRRTLGVCGGERKTFTQSETPSEIGAVGEDSDEARH